MAYGFAARSGITRHVHLTAVDPVHIARWGTFVTTPNLASTIKQHYADVHVATQIANDGASQRAVRVAYTVADPNGHVVARARTAARNVPAGGATDTVDLRVDHPNLWSTTNPALYTVKTRVIGHDRASATFGIR